MKAAKMGEIMPEPITVYLTPDLKQALDDACRRDGISANELIGRAVKNYLFSRQFRDLRQRLAVNAATQGILTDQDVFHRVS